MTAENEIICDIIQRFVNFRRFIGEQDAPSFEAPTKDEEMDGVLELIEEEWADIGFSFSEQSQEWRDSYDERDTDIPVTEFSRHYEATSVAKQLLNGKWVGYTYWYGGGKHGEPQAMPWIEDAYFFGL